MARHRSEQALAIIAAMRAKHAKNELVTIDDNAKVEFAGGGAWVQGWLWYDDPLQRNDLYDDDQDPVAAELSALRSKVKDLKEKLEEAYHPITVAPPLFRPLTAGRMAGKKRILALDLKQPVAWAIRSADTGIVHGTYRLDAWRFRNWVATVIAEGEIEAVHVVEGHQWMLPHLEKVCIGAGVPLQSASPGAIKKHITGRGVATATALKAAIEARRYEPADEIEAMAIGLLLLAEQPAQRKGKAA